jgi:hypothetical protein
MYSVAQYKDIIHSKDADTQKRFGMIERLSKDFTVDNPTARQLDQLLTEQLELEKKTVPVPASTPSPAPKRESKPASTNNNLKELETSFNELFDALKNHTKQDTSVNPETMQKALRELLHDTKIGFDQLDSEVQKKLSGQTQIIKYSLPPAPTTAFKKPEISTFQTIVDDVMMGNNVMLIGGAGTGKTYLAENLVSKLALGRNYITINCSQWTSPTEIIGGQTMDGYQEGKLIEAWKNGYVLILDELPKIDPNTAGLFNDALAKTKVHNAVIFNSRRESFVKHEGFACIATGNIYPDKESISYGANNKQDLSLLDRFSGSVYFIEKNPSIEKQIIQNDMLWSVCDRIRTVIEEMKYEAQLSLRFMQNARDTFNLEMQRIKDNGKDGIKANDGKTFKSTVESYLSTFTEIQQKNIKEKIRYNEIFKGFEYRSFKTTQSLF